MKKKELREMVKHLETMQSMYIDRLNEYQNNRSKDIEKACSKYREELEHSQQVRKYVADKLSDMCIDFDKLQRQYEHLQLEHTKALAIIEANRQEQQQ